MKRGRLPGGAKFRLICTVLTALLGLLVIGPGSVHARSVGVAVIETGGAGEVDVGLHRLFKDELLALFKGEQDVDFSIYPLGGNAGVADTNALLERAYDDPGTDMVLVLDFAANQVIGRRAAFAKPTFLPMVINGRLLGYPLSGTGSGRKNLNYQTIEFDFEEELGILHRVAPFRRAVLIGGARTEQSIGSKMLAGIKAQARKAGVDLTVVTYGGDVSALMAALPEDTDAVLYGGLPGADRREIRRIIGEVNKRGIVSFSLAGEAFVRLGAFATNNPDTDWEKLARRTAIHMQEVFLGTPASGLPVLFESAGRLMINMETSRQIRYAPGFDLLSEATLINEERDAAGVKYSLGDVAKQAVKTNLSLMAERLRTMEAAEAVNESRAALLPRIDSSLDWSTRKETDGTRSGALVESSADASLTLTQSLFSEKRRADYAIQKYAHLSEQERLRETELDIVQTAVNAYLDVLREKTSLEQERYNLGITRENYRLARNRVEIGASDASDLYRWESVLANAKRSVLSAKATLEQRRQILNRVLNRPIKEAFSTTVETLDNPLLLISDKRVTDLVVNRYDLEKLTDFLVERGLAGAPELKGLEARIGQGRRRLLSSRRAYWLPEVNLTGEYTRNIDEDRDGGGTPAEENDWRLGLTLSLPLYEGGARKARTAQNRLAVKKLETDYRDLGNVIEQEIRANAEAVHASYGGIDLSAAAERASRKNYELVSASYALGRDSITAVLDAQEALIEAREASMNAVYSFLVDLMNLQRAVGSFDFFLTDEERLSLSEEISERVGE